MKNKKYFSVLILIALALLSAASAGCNRYIDTGLEHSQLPVANTEIPTITKAPTNTSTPRPTPTVTETETPTFIPTDTATPTPAYTEDVRMWNKDQIGEWMRFVGSWILYDPRFPQEGDTIAELVTQFYCIDKVCSHMEGPVDTYPAKDLCEWAFKHLMEGYSTIIAYDGKVFEEKTQQERWEQFSREAGNPNRDLYCPQFDKNFGSPIFSSQD